MPDIFFAIQKSSMIDVQKSVELKNQLHIIKPIVRVSNKSYVSCNPLEYACILNREEIALYLIEEGSDVSSNNFRALDFAIMNTNEKIVHALLQKCSLRPEAKKSLLNLAAGKPNGNILKYLLACDEHLPIHETNNSPILAAAAAGLVENLEILIEAGYNPRIEDDFAICLAARNGHLAALDFLRAQGCNPRNRNEYALNAAVINGHTAVVERLLALGADPTINDCEALHNAVAKQFTEIQNLLLCEIHKRNATVTINNAQSSHTASVHKSASESAIRLMIRYHEKYKDNIVDEIRSWLVQLNTAQAQTALNCLDRLCVPQNKFVDPVSQISIVTLLGLAWLAIHDEGLRQGSLADAQLVYLEGMLEIQRGDNLDINGIDDGLADKPICPGGAFNKIIEKLVSIHPDASLVFISKALASLQLPFIVKEEARNYLSHFDGPAGLKELATALHLLKEGLGGIWDKIKPKVSQRMIESFESIYGDATNKDFIALIDMGIYASIDVDCFKEKVIRSDAYQNYLSFRCETPETVSACSLSDDTLEEEINRLEKSIQRLSL